MKYWSYIITFLVSGSIGYFLGFLEAKFKIKTLNDTLEKNDKNAQEYLNWLKEDVRKHINENMKSIKDEIRKMGGLK